MNTKEFKVLAISEGHTAAAALSINGKVVAAAAEERFSRLKCDMGYPRRAIRFCLDKAGLVSSDLDQVVMVGENFSFDEVCHTLFKKYGTFSTLDYVYENENYWKPLLIEGKKDLNYFQIMGGKSRVREQAYDLSGFDWCENPHKTAEQFQEIRLKTAMQDLQIPSEKISFVNHWECHSHYAYYASPLRGSDVIIANMEGSSGGHYNSYVSFHQNNRIEKVAATGKSDIGRTYQWMTLVLGMLPENHEYKVMGLAPYANQKELKKSYEVFKDILQLDEEQGLIVHKNRPKDLYFHFLDKLKGHRFDGIAGGLQLMTETLLVDWFSHLMKRHGKRKFVYAGGVAQNIKANMLIGTIRGLEDFYVPGAPGDETLAIGACYIATEEHWARQGKDTNTIPPLENLYLGPEFTGEAVERAVAKVDGGKFEVRRKVRNADIAELLANDVVIATCRGPMEFGCRALGNRSILANPRNGENVEKINSQIKYRDFWMPFAPSSVPEYQEKYFVNPTGLRLPYMTIGTPVTEVGKRELPAAIHRGDNSARPQIVMESANPLYHQLIKEFGARTGTYAILNTSFNLHGEPIVCSPEDALHTMERSELDGVLLDDTLVLRKRN